jgi:hypothetical protein
VVLLGETLARFTHERYCFREDDRHDRADLLGLLLRRALDVDAVDLGNGQIDRELDGVVGPSKSVRALHLLGKFAEPPLEIIRVSEEATERVAFHTANATHGAPPQPRPRRDHLALRAE